jgi:hypothetical protein
LETAALPIELLACKYFLLCPAPFDMLKPDSRRRGKIFMNASITR